MSKHIASPEEVKRNGLAYIRRGWRVLPIHTPGPNGSCSCGRTPCPGPGKHPRLKDWVEQATLVEDRFLSWLEQWPNMNLGVAMGQASNLIDIEVDPHNGGDDGLADLELFLGALPDTLSFRSGSGGVHRLFLAPRGVRVKTVGQLGKDLLKRAKTGVDVRGEGGQAVFPPSRHVSGNTYKWLNEAPLARIPESWLDVLAGTSPADGETQEQDAGLAFLERGPLVLDDITIDAARDILRYVSPETTRHTWVTVGEALHTQFGREGLDLFVEWSRGDLNGVRPANFVGDEDCEYNWTTFGKQTGGRLATFRSVIELAKEGGWSAKPAASKIMPADEREQLKKEDEARFQAFKQQMEEAGNLEELMVVTEEIKNTELFDASREELAELLRGHYERLTGKKVTKATADELLDDKPAAEERARAAVKESGWADPYAFCAEGEGCFYNRTNRSRYKTKTFDQLYASELITPIMRAQGKLVPPFLPSVLLLNADLIPKTYGVRYAPGQPELFEREGQAYVNDFIGFDASKVPPPDLLTLPEKEAVQRWQKHLLWLLGRDSARVVTAFLAYVAQNPGKRVRWCPLIYGPEGIGKSLIGEMMRAVLNGNVKVVGPAALAEPKYNDWADGSQLSVIEEMKVDGASKWEVMRTLKEPITNDRINIVPKGQPGYQTINTTSYMAFTNHANALAVAAGDRRYFVTSSRFTSRRGFIADLGGDGAAARYFADLVAAFNDQPDALRSWLTSVSLADFDPNGAPDSEEKQEMVEGSKSELQVAIERIISGEEAATVRPEAIELEALKGLLMLDPDVRGATGQGIARMLRDMGYKMLTPGGPIKVKLLGGEPSRSRWFGHIDTMRAKKLNGAIPVSKVLEVLVPGAETCG